LRAAQRRNSTPNGILELGCGAFREAPLYSVVFGTVQIIGIDRYLPYAIPDALCIQADAAQLPFSRRFDLIVIRHPDVDRHPDAWFAAITLTPDHLNDGGLLLITTYSAGEAIQARDWLKTTPLIPVTPNPMNEPDIPAPNLSGRDRFVWLYTAIHA
jgi:hypothetical protein